MSNTPNKQDAGTSARGVKWYRSALADAEAEIQTKNKTIAELQRNAHHHVARIAQLTEENEELRKERDSYKEQLYLLQEQHATELREVTEEMAAAAHFSEKEWREHCDRVEAQCARLRRTVDACMPAILEYLPHAEAAARQKLQHDEEAQRYDLRSRQWVASLKEVRTRDTARAETVFAARGLSMSELRRTHLGKGPTTDEDSYDAEEGLYNLFLALRPGGPVDGFAMRELLKGETEVTQLFYDMQGQPSGWYGKHFIIPSADAYELVACALCHLPALKELGFRYLPPLSTRGLEWVSHLPMSVEWLYLWNTDYAVADLREIHHRRGRRTFVASLHREKCTDWGEYAGVGDDGTKRARVNEELGGMVYWRR